jgi:hypothetical protein
MRIFSAAVLPSAPWSFRKAVNQRTSMLGWFSRGGLFAYREYSKQYVDLEEEAKREGRGIWVGEFDNPAEWRRQQRGGGSGSSSNNNSNSNIGVNASIPSPSSSLNEEGCTIKGNISSNGEKIYHVIGSPSYAATIINESKGERWFCSEDEAVAAGWRESTK